MTAVATTTTGGRAVADALAAHGVEVVWGIPGTHNLEIYAGLGAAGIRHLSPRHEQGAAFAADGYSRVTGRVGVCVTTSGPAVLNAATALGQSYSDSIPVLLVAAGMPLRAPGAGQRRAARDEGPRRRARRRRRLRPSRDERGRDPGRGRAGVRAHGDRPPAPGRDRGPARPPGRGGHGAGRGRRAAARPRARTRRRRRRRGVPRPRPAPRDPRGRRREHAPRSSCASSPSGSARRSCARSTARGRCPRTTR